MNGANLSAGAAFDQHSLDALKTAVKNNSPEGMKATARQMEGLFVQMMLKSMRDASFKDGLFNSSQSDLFTSMYDQQIAQKVSEDGRLGFADLMMKQMTGKAPDHVVTHSPAVPLSLSLARFGLRASQTGGAVATGALLPGSAHQRESAQESRGFLSRLLKPAMDVARRSGIPHQLILAQAALESGWGNKEIVTAQGKPSHNLFGVKATDDWQGETTDVTTTEYTNGVAQKVKGTFKVYHSYAEALSDYTSLLLHNPRYRHVLQAGTPEMAAKALQSAGYATDPDYAQKLTGIIRQIKGSVNQAIRAYNTDLSSLF